MKKILIHSLTFSPDGVSTAYLYSDIAAAFKAAGYDVVVLSTTPHYNLVPEQLEQQRLEWGLWGIYKKSEYKGIPVYHVPQKKFKNTLLRLIGFVYWHVVSFLIALSIRNVDIVLSPSPPLTLGWLNLFLAKLKGCKVVYNVQEIYPDILGKEGTFVHGFLEWMERKVYDGSDAVTTIDKVFYDTIAPRFKDKSKLHIIPNFVDTDLYHAGISTESLNEELFPRNDSLKLLYAGNIGYAQDWDTLVSLAIKTKNENIEYYVIGEGVMKSFLEQKRSELDLEKLHILPYQPRELMPSILSYSDIQFIFMTPQMEMQGFPSKVYTIMACGKPLLVSSGEGTPISAFLGPIGCAKIAGDYDAERKTNEMARWLSSVSREELQLMGEKGERVILEKYTKEIVSSQYVNLVNSLL